VFVVRGSFTTTRIAQRALELLHDRQVCVLGAVCNRGSDDIADYNYEKVYQIKNGTRSKSSPQEAGTATTRSEDPASAKVE
jgi:hypothetical protein